jgi:hypothetical protein
VKQGKMKFPVVVCMVSYLVGSVHCIDIRQFFNNWFSSSKKATNSMFTASDCKIINDRRVCKFKKAKNLKLDVDNIIELNVDDKNGRTIKCEKKLNKFNNMWYGSCDGDADDMNVIKRYDEVDGTERIFGSIHVGDDVCRISPNIDDGELDIDCKPKNSYKAEDAPKKSSGTAVLPPERRRHLNTLFGFTPMNDNVTNDQGVSLRGYNQTEHRRRLFDDSGSNIDVMVVWTKAAECRNAGMNAGCALNANTENKMRGLIDLAVEETNTAFELSGIFTSLRLVHAYRDSSYVERGRGDFYSYLEHVTDDGDGSLDSVHDKRALYGADAVQLLVGTSYFPLMMSCCTF